MKGNEMAAALPVPKRRVVALPENHPASPIAPMTAMHRRLKAAIEAAPFCHPQLKATAVILGSDFPTKL